MKSGLRGPLWDLTRGQRGRYGAAILAMGLSNVFLFGVPFISKTAIDGALGAQAGAAGAGADVVGGMDTAAEPGSGLVAGAAELFSGFAADHSTAAALWMAAGLIGLLTALGGVCLYLRGRWASVASEAIVKSLRQRLFQHLERLPCTYHDRADTGDLVQRCTSDVETIRVFLTGQVVEIGRTILLVLTVLPVMLALDGRMTAVSLVMFPVIFTFAIVFFRRVQHLFLLSDEAEGAMTAVLQENLSGIRVVRAFARQDFEREKFAVQNEEFRDRTAKLIRFLGVYWAASDFLCLLQLGGTLVFGGWWAAGGHISVGTLFAFLTYQAIVIWPVRHLGRVLTDTGKALVALGRVREILEVEEETAPETPVVPETEE
ncbi:MAG: ABC transporter ATP-binding protein, partial [Gemmatimonadetes bacterium]|nr:ABC transporter ATP-binding protein [Gemmatimonadota bacterium]